MHCCSPVAGDIDAYPSYPEYRGRFVPKPQAIDLEGIANRVVSLPADRYLRQIVGLDGDRVMWVSCQLVTARWLWRCGE